MLAFNNVSVNYGHIEALHEISIKIPDQSIVAILGPNGAGKTTTLKAISGVLPLKNGSIVFDGTQIHHLPPEKRVRHGITQSPEGRQIFSKLTVEENLRIGTYALKNKKKTKENFEKVLSYFPVIKGRLKQSAGTLSGGEQQMLAIGRALMAEPKLLLLDEPSLGLAPLIVRDIFNIIQSINEDGTSILLVEQNANLALRYSHYSYIFELGKVALEGSSSELQNNAKIQQLYLGNN